MRFCKVKITPVFCLPGQCAMQFVRIRFSIRFLQLVFGLCLANVFLLFSGTRDVDFLPDPSCRYFNHIPTGGLSLQCGSATATTLLNSYTFSSMLPNTHSLSITNFIYTSSEFPSITAQLNLTAVTLRGKSPMKTIAARWISPATAAHAAHAADHHSLGGFGEDNALNQDAVQRLL